MIVLNMLNILGYFGRNEQNSYTALTVLMCCDIFIYIVNGDGAHTKHLHSLYV